VARRKLPPHVEEAKLKRIDEIDEEVAFLSEMAKLAQTPEWETARKSLKGRHDALIERAYTETDPQKLSHIMGMAAGIAAALNTVAPHYRKRQQLLAEKVRIKDELHPERK